MAKRLAQHKPPAPVVAATKHNIQQLMLVTGDWHKRFAEGDVEATIAEALQYCVHNDGMVVLGYCISYTNVCLVLYAHKRSVQNILTKFYSSVRAILVRKEGVFMEETTVADTGDEWQTVMEVSVGRLFKRSDYVDEYLVKLITGKKINLPYYDPALARLERKLRHYTWCSVIDYEGGKGPVKVSLMGTAEDE